MPVAAQQVRFKWYRYTDNATGHWSVKENATWGDNADSGLTTFNPADKVFIRSSRNFPRYIILIDTQTGRTIKRTCGTLACDAWATPGYTLDVPVIGLEDSVTFTVKKHKNEAFTEAGNIFPTPQPSEAA